MTVKISYVFVQVLYYTQHNNNRAEKEEGECGTERIKKVGKKCI